MSIIGEYKGYNPTEDPTIMNVFATAAFRFGHTLINPVLKRYVSSYQSYSPYLSILILLPPTDHTISRYVTSLATPGQTNGSV